MICMMRPRRPLVSDEAPITATESGHRSFPISGTGFSRTRGSAQAEAARNDAAQDLGRAALDRQLGCDRRRERELLVERRAVRRLRLEKCRQLARAGGKLLLPRGSEVLDDRALD